MLKPHRLDVALHHGKLRGEEKIQFLNKKLPKKETCFTSCLNNGFYQKLPKLGAKWFGCWSRALSVLPCSANDNRTALQNPSQGLQLEKNTSLPSRLTHQVHPSHFNTSNKTRFENKLYIESTGQHDICSSMRTEKSCQSNHGF